MQKINKVRIKEECGDYLSQKGIDLSKAFRCFNPDHEDHHPSMRFDSQRNKAHCFSCGADYDLFDLIGIDYNLQTPAEAFRKAEELFGIQEQPQDILHKRHDVQGGNGQDDYCYSRHQAVAQTNYFIRRGLSTTLISKFQLGYDPAFHTQENGVPAVWRAAIVPTGNQCYLARNIDSKGKDDRIRKRGGNPLFHIHALEGGSPVFVVEGEFDALSVIEAGGEAVGLGSTANASRFLQYCKEHPPTQPILLCLDQDEEGRKAEEKLQTGLLELGIPVLCVPLPRGCKDANEALIADRVSLTAFIQNVTRQAVQLRKQQEQQSNEEYRLTSASGFMGAFLGGIEASADTPCIPTGFQTLDKLLDGGLYEGLLCIGAITSLGKTTFIMQMADQIARQKQDVLIFSLEMARSELMAKSISRLTLFHAGHPRDAKTARGITSGIRYATYSLTERELIKKAVSQYAGYAEHIFIREGIGNIGVENIRQSVEEHRKATGKAPVVVVDYLQLLAPWDVRASDKQNTDRAVLELKRISRDYKCPVIAISSFNRQNYNQAVTMEAFKESGAIEYSSDVLIGLQSKGAGADGFRTDDAKQKDPRAVELKILKNRNGPTGGKVEYAYYPLFNYFQEEGSSISDYK